MSERKSEIIVYSGPDRGALAACGEPVTARNAPAIVKATGRSAEFAWKAGSTHEENPRFYAIPIN
jgi:hypothetical protein